MSIKTNAKLFALQEEVMNAIKEGTLVQKMDVLRLQAGEIGIEGSAFDSIVEEQKKLVEKQKKDIEIVRPKKTMLITASLVAIIIEWVIGLLGGISLGKVILLLIINFVTVLIIIFGVSYYINRKNN